MPESIRSLPDRALIGMVHLTPLPASPDSEAPLSQVIARAVHDARRLADAGFDALMIENFGDTPFHASSVEPHVVAMMTVIGRAVRRAVSLPIGINVLRNDAQAALSVALAVEACFVRVNIHCGAYATDQGLIEGRAAETLRFRRRLGADGRQGEQHIAILADVHVKHARPIGGGRIEEAARETAYRGRADGLIVSGQATGEDTDLRDLLAVRAAVPDRPIYVGSGANAATAGQLLAFADGLIVGTAVKENGVTTAPVDPERAAAFVRAARRRWDEDPPSGE